MAEFWMLKPPENKKAQRICMVGMKPSIETLQNKVEEISHQLEGFDYQKGKIKMFKDLSIQKVQYKNN